MNEIEKYRSNTLQRTKLGILEILFSDVDRERHSIQLVITMDERNLNIKEFSNYLDFIYRIDGLTSRLGYKNYVQNRNNQVEITRFQLGSFEIIIEKLLEGNNVDQLAIMWLALKYLPQVINSLTDSAGKLMDVLAKREDYLDKRDRRKLRKQIRELLNEEVELTSLDKKGKEKLVDLLDEMYVRNRRRLAPASRFARYFVQSVKLVLGDKNSS